MYNLMLFGKSVDGVKILDVCCCPGSKLQMIHSLVKGREPGSSIIGVDISDKRISVCKSLLRKTCSRISEDHPRDRILIFQCDGRLFSPTAFGILRYDSAIRENREFASHYDRQKLNKSTRSMESKYLKSVEKAIRVANTSAAELDSSSTTTTSSFSSSTPSLRGDSLNDFDLVLVDAECRHDASYRHMKFLRDPSDATLLPAEPLVAASPADESYTKGKSSHHHRPLKRKAALSHSGPDGATDISVLQKDLLRNGYRLLKPGGVLVYCTCSEDALQNEAVVAALLAEEPSAELLHALPDRLRDGIDASGTAAVHDILTKSIDELAAFARGLSEDQLAALSAEICAAAAHRSSPLYREGSLPGTVRVDYRGGMSGHFIARLRKKLC